MTKVVNLRQARKARQRREKQAAAEANRARFGRSKPEKRERSREDEAVARRHDGHRLDDDGNEPA